jgi:RNA polymerase sigma factor (sigma-70 family)
MSSLVPVPASSPSGPWADALAEARRTWGPFALPLERFVARAEAVVARRLAREGKEPTPAARADVIGRTARVDLALAVACEDGASGAWEALHGRLLPRLSGLARKRGRSDVDAEALASDVLSEMALPPGGSSPARTLLGTFDGTGSLFGWSAVILVRRLSRLRPALLPPQAPEPPALDPATVFGDADDARRFDLALRGAWDALSGRERLALAWRYLDGRSQVEIARRLRLSPPRVSRVVTGAVEKLRAALEHVDPDGRADPRLWATLADAVRRHLAPTSAAAPLPGQAGPRPAAREP